MSSPQDIEEDRRIDRGLHPFRGLWRAILRPGAGRGPHISSSRVSTGLRRAVGLLTYKQGVDAFRGTDRLSDGDKGTLMGGALQRVYRWPPRTARGGHSAAPSAPGAGGV